MRKLAKSLFLVLVPLLLLHDVLTFSVNNFGRRSLSSSSSSFTAKKPSWSDDSNIIRDNLPQITHDLVHRLDTSVGSLVSTLTIDTVSYYMLEFRNDVLQRWMMQFANYSTSGFPNNDWTQYIEKMITVGDHKVQVVMKPPKTKPKLGEPAMGPGMAIQYDFDIEPRKVANQILTVRENVCEEIINDLNSIQYENDEAARFAKVWVMEGREAAEKSRKLTRMQGQGGSTPQRDRNFRDVSIYITELAINMVKDNCVDNYDSNTVEYLDKLLKKLEKERVAQPLQDQILNKQYGPRTLLEELFHEAMMGSVGETSVNVMKLSNMIADTRWAITVQVQNLLRMQNANSRKYYKMIKDHGGVLSYGKKGRAEFKIVNLEEEKRRKQEEEAAALVAKQVQEQAGLSDETANSEMLIPDNIFGNDMTKQQSSSVNTREAVSASGTNFPSSLSIGSNVTNINPTEGTDEGEVNLMDVDFGMAGPISM